MEYPSCRKAWMCFQMAVLEIPAASARACPEIHEACIKAVKIWVLGELMPRWSAKKK
jgi:hypothetical protein